MHSKDVRKKITETFIKEKKKMINNFYAVEHVLSRGNKFYRKQKIVTESKLLKWKLEKLFRNNCGN